jgi:phage FluMu protein Com
MAVVKCSHCGRLANVKALRCPKCGKLLNSEDKHKPPDAPELGGICH